MSDGESYLHPICMKSDAESDRESDAKTNVQTATYGARLGIHAGPAGRAGGGNNIIKQ
jgi:hypothetical protein